ncbi:MAG: hypothetical protein BGP04_25075 [Rhizobiales bacterium 62-17]|nr:hypothetical protein [Hyphomicrobiales bacterium]OJY00774.1 MAG: hypothetical protein BGP04_25075 [Rhizobiales bacterium 62-17]
MIEPSTLRLLRLTFAKGFLLNLEDALRADAMKARDIVRDHSGLKDRRRARGAEGQLRFRMMEERFEELCKEYGGKILEGGVIPDTDLNVFQPFCRFETEGRGFIFGLAAMPEPKAIPPKNKSRLAGVSINCHLLPGLFDTGGPKIGDVFVLLLVARDRDRAGLIEEMAIGILDSKYESFLFYEPLEKFVSDHLEVPTEPSLSPVSAAPSVTLKKGVAPFVPPEAPAVADKKNTGTN